MSFTTSHKSFLTSLWSFPATQISLPKVLWEFHYRQDIAKSAEELVYNSEDSADNLGKFTYSGVYWKLWWVCRELKGVCWQNEEVHRQLKVVHRHVKWRHWEYWTIYQRVNGVRLKLRSMRTQLKFVVSHERFWWHLTKSSPTTSSNEFTFPSNSGKVRR